MFNEENLIFRKLKPKRPVVKRVGDVVKTCHYYKTSGKCLGPLCLWPRVGRCPIFNRIKPEFTAK